METEQSDLYMEKASTTDSIAKESNGSVDSENNIDEQIELGEAEIKTKDNIEYDDNGIDRKQRNVEINNEMEYNKVKMREYIEVGNVRKIDEQAGKNSLENNSTEEANVTYATNHINFQVSGSDASDGTYSRVIIVGDSYLRQLKKDWPQGHQLTPYFVCKDNCLYSDIPTMLRQHTFLEETERILIICAAGVNDLLALEQKSCASSHQPLLLPCFRPKTKEHFSRIGAETLKQIISTRMALTSTIQNATVVFLYIPYVNLVQTHNEMIVENKHQHKDCTCVTNEELKNHNIALFKVIKWVNEKIYTFSLPNLIGKWQCYMKFDVLQYNASGWTFDRFIQQNKQKQLVKYFSHLSQSQQTSETNDLNITKDAKSQENERPVFIISNSWAENLVNKDWSSTDKPTFEITDDTDLADIQEHIFKISSTNKNAIIIVCPPLKCFLQIKSFSECEQHLSLKYPVPYETLTSNPKEFAAKIAENILVLHNLKTVNKCQIIFTTCYPIDLGSYYEHLEKEHSQLYGHSIGSFPVTEKQCKMFQSKLAVVLNTLNKHLLVANKKQQIPSCPIKGIVHTSSESSKLSFPVHVENINPNAQLSLRLYDCISSFIMKLKKRLTNSVPPNKPSQRQKIKTSLNNKANKENSGISNTSKSNGEAKDNTGERTETELRVEGVKDVDSGAVKTSHSELTEEMSPHIHSDASSLTVLDELEDSDKDANEGELNYDSTENFEFHVMDETFEEDCNDLRQSANIKTVRTVVDTEITVEVKEEDSHWEEVAGEDMEEGKFSRIVIVGDAYVESISCSWPSESEIKPYFMWKNSLYVDDVWKHMSQHEFLEDNDKILLICMVGINDVLKFEKHKECSVPHPSLRIPNLSLKNVRNEKDAVDDVMYKMKVTKKKLLSSLGKESSVVFTELPTVSLISNMKNLFALAREKYEGCVCSLLMTTRRTTDIENSFKAIIKAINQRIFNFSLSKIRGYKYLQFSYFGTFYEEDKWHMQELSLRVINVQLFNLLNGLLSSKTRKENIPLREADKLEISKIFDDNGLKNKKVLFVGNTWLQAIAESWPIMCNIRPLFASSSMVTIDDIADIVVKAIDKDEEAIVITGVNLHDFVEYKSYSGCTDDHPALKFPVPKKFVLQNPDKFSKDLLVKIDTLQKKVARTHKHTAVIFTTTYPINFEYCYKHLTEEHRSKIRHSINERLADPPRCRLFRSCLNRLTNNLSQALTERNQRRSFPTCNIMSVVLDSSYEIRFMYPLYIENMNPNRTLKNKLSKFIENYLDCLDNLLTRKRICLTMTEEERKDLFSDRYLGRNQHGSRGGGDYSDGGRGERTDSSQLKSTVSRQFNRSRDYSPYREDHQSKSQSSYAPRRSISPQGYYSSRRPLARSRSPIRSRSPLGRGEKRAPPSDAYDRRYCRSSSRSLDRSSSSRSQSPLVSAPKQPLVSKKRNYSSSSSRSRSRSDSPRKTMPAAIRKRQSALDDLWVAHKRECDMYRRNPEAHPDYSREKRAFIEDRGSSFSVTASTREWQSLWRTKMEELFDMAWREKKRECLVALEKNEAILTEGSSSSSSSNTSSSPSPSPEPQRKEKSKGKKKKLDKPSKKKLKKEKEKNKKKAKKASEKKGEAEKRPKLESQSSSESKPMMSLDEIENRINQLMKKTGEQQKSNKVTKGTRMKSEEKQEVTSSTSSLVSPSSSGGLDIKLASTVRLLVKIADKFGAIGKSIVVLKEKINESLLTGRDPMELLNDDAFILFDIIIDKIQSNIDDTNVPFLQKAVLQEALDRLQEFLQTAKKKDNKKPAFGLDINSIAAATLGRDPPEVITFIKNALLFHKTTTIKEQDLVDLFTAVKNAQSAMLGHATLTPGPTKPPPFPPPPQHHEIPSARGAGGGSPRSGTEQKSEPLNISEIRNRFFALPMNEKLAMFSNFNRLNQEEKSFLLMHLQELQNTDKELAHSLRFIIAKNRK